MNNKPNIFFVPDKYSFVQEGIPFTNEMLEWPIYILKGITSDEPVEVTDVEFNTLYRNAFRGLLLIPEFTVKISLQVAADIQRLYLTPWTWGTISFGNKEILTFMHDSRDEKHVFNHIYEWVELHDIQAMSVSYAQVKKQLAGWSVEKWQEFFRARLSERVVLWEKQAYTLRTNANELIKNADEVRTVLLGKTDVVS